MAVPGVCGDEHGAGGRSGASGGVGWCSYRELMGQRKRYRLIDRSHFLDATGQGPATAEFRANYAEAIAQRIAAAELGREPEWTEALAVGSAGYIEQVASRLENRLRLDREPAPGNAWILREDREAYALDALFGPRK